VIDHDERYVCMLEMDLAKYSGWALELEEALRLVTDALNDPGVGDIEQWKRDCKIGTAKARAALAKRPGQK